MTQIEKTGDNKVLVGCGTTLGTESNGTTDLGNWCSVL